MRRVLIAVTVLALLAGGCAQRDEQNPIAIAIAGTPPAAAAEQGAPKVSPATTVNPDDVLFKVAQCLRQNGIDVPDPGSAEDKTWKYTGDPAKMEKALKACEKYTSQIPNPLNDPKVRDQLIQYARCMREQGIDMPDPPQVNKNLDPNDPKLQKAAGSCAKLIPKMEGGQ
ncbi:hypothetical protein [Nonomuraea helvata]|uniref:Secreted protein n=1 Tax=Nonomuraea helvata TaxID=37484 RepID=A0ABV5SEL1_9ACTN